MMDGWQTIDADMDLLTVAIPVDVYRKLKALGSPRALIAQALRTSDRPVRGITISAINTGPQVNVSLPIEDYLADMVRRKGSDAWVLEQVLALLEQRKPPKPVDPTPVYL